MPNIAITVEAHNAIRAAANNFSDTSQPLGEGMVSIEVTDATIDRLADTSLLGETISDTIIRIASIFKQNGKTN